MNVNYNGVVVVVAVVVTACEWNIRHNAHILAHSFAPTFTSNDLACLEMRLLLAVLSPDNVQCKMCQNDLHDRSGSIRTWALQTFSQAHPGRTKFMRKYTPLRAGACVSVYLIWYVRVKWK